MKKFIQINKIYFIILSVFSLFFLFFCIKKNDIVDIDFILLSYLLVTIILFFSYLTIIHYQIHFYPINVFFNLYILVCYLYFFYNFNYIVAVTYPWIFDVLDRDSFISMSIETSKVLILTMFFFNLGFFLCFRLFKEKKINFLPELNEIQFLRLNFFLLITKLFFIVIHFLFNKNIPQLLDPINLLIVCISFYSLIFFKNNKKLNFFIILLIFIENSLLTFSIYKNIILLTVCFIIIYNLKKEVSNVLLGLLILWVLIGQPFKFDARVYYIENVEINNIDEMDETLEESKRSRTKVFDDYEVTPLIFRLSEPIVSLVRILEFENIKKKEIKKDTISILKYALIPRIIYPEKPKQEFAYWYTDYFFDVYSQNPKTRKTVTYNIFWPSDFYINFQYFGSTIFAFIVGVILSLFSLILTNYKSNNLHYLFGLSLISAFSFPDYNLSLILSPFFFQVLIILILLKIFSLIIKR